MWGIDNIKLKRFTKTFYYSNEPQLFELEFDRNGFSFYFISIRDIIESLGGEEKIVSIMIGSNGNIEGISLEHSARIYCQTELYEGLFMSLVIWYYSN